MSEIQSKDIGKYVVYSDGRVWTKKYKRFLKPTPTRDGYLKVSIVNKGISVHRLVYQCFRGEIGEGLEIDHLDGNRINNCVDNLEAVTHKENIRRAAARGSYKNNPLRQGQNHGRAILDDIKVLTILTMPKRKKNGAKPGWSDQELADIYGVSKTRIGHIRNGREWKHLQ